MFRGLYRHLRSGNLYFAEGLAMHSKNSEKMFVVYCQKFEDTMGGSINLPVGTMWVRDVDDFKSNFEKVDEPIKALRLIKSFETSLEKDVLAGYNKI